MYYFERIDRKISNMSAMLTRFGIDPAVFAQRLGASFGASVRICQMCSRGEQCQQWLADARSVIEHVPEFCPNAQRLHSAKAAIQSSKCPTLQG